MSFGGPPPRGPYPPGKNPIFVFFQIRKPFKVFNMLRTFFKLISIYLMTSKMNFLKCRAKNNGINIFYEKGLFLHYHLLSLSIYVVNKSYIQSWFIIIIAFRRNVVYKTNQIQNTANNALACPITYFSLRLTLLYSSCFT